MCLMHPMRQSLLPRGCRLLADDCQQLQLRPVSAASPPGAARRCSQPFADIIPAPTTAATPCLQIGELIAGAMAKVGRGGVVTMEESRTAEDHLYVVEGMQFDRGYISPYFVTDPERMVSQDLELGRGLGDAGLVRAVLHLGLAACSLAMATPPPTSSLTPHGAHGEL